MDATFLFAKAIHVVGFILWIGSLFGLGSILIARGDEPDAGFGAKLGALAKGIGRSADVGAALAIAGGLGMLSTNAAYYMHQPWMHAKLTLILAVLGVHGLLRAKGKRGGAIPRAIPAVLALVAIAIVVLAVFKPWGR